MPKVLDKQAWAVHLLASNSSELSSLSTEFLLPSAIPWHKLSRCLLIFYVSTWPRASRPASLPVATAQHQGSLGSCCQGSSCRRKTPKVMREETKQREVVLGSVKGNFHIRMQKTVINFFLVHRCWETEKRKLPSEPLYKSGWDCSACVLNKPRSLIMQIKSCKSDLGGVSEDVLSSLIQGTSPWHTAS